MVGSRRAILLTIISFQVLFIVSQLYIFYPCIMNRHAFTVEKTRTADEKHGPFEEVEQSTKTKSKTTLHSRTRSESKDRGKYKPTWKSLDARPLPHWYDDAKLGVFIHWGVFSVPGFLDRDTRGAAEWFWWYWKGKSLANHDFGGKAKRSAQNYMKSYPAGFQYTDFARDFNAEFFDPNEWVETFKASGARYIVLVSKHHEGFTLWPSKWSWNWNSVDAGPNRDIVGDLAQAVRRNSSLKFGLYYSQLEWFNPMYQADKKAGFRTQTYIQAKMMPEQLDLVKRYRPDIVWSDGFAAPSTYWNSTQFLAWLYNDSPVKDKVVTNDRWGGDTMCKHGGYLTCKDRYQPGSLQHRKWENCMTIDKGSWGHRRNANLADHYSIERLIGILVETVSYGGNLLMNVGPTASGRIPPLQEERLHQVGQWMKVNGKAIYGSKVWKYQRDKISKSVYYTSKLSRAGSVHVYAVMLKWPESEKLELSAPQARDNTRISMLGHHGQLVWSKRRDGGIIINMPKFSVADMPCHWAWTFKLEDLQNA